MQAANPAHPATLTALLFDTARCAIALRMGTARRDTQGAGSGAPDRAEPGRGDKRTNATVALGTPRGGTL